MTSLSKKFADYTRIIRPPEDIARTKRLTAERLQYGERRRHACKWPFVVCPTCHGSGTA